MTTQIKVNSKDNGKRYSGIWDGKYKQLDEHNVRIRLADIRTGSRFSINIYNFELRRIQRELAAA